MESIDFFPNLAEAIEDSVPQMLEYQKMLREKSNKASETTQNNPNPDKKRIMADSSDQVTNSPLKDL